MIHIFKKKQDKAMIGDRLYRVQVNSITTPTEWNIHQQIEKLRKAGKPYIELVRELNRICAVQQVETHNLLPTAGRAAVASHLTAGSPSPSTLRVNYVALGSGSASPANADTTLATEVYRNLTASATNSNNIAYITGFFSATETNGTYAEVGLFIAGTASANTGSLFSRALLSVTKSSVQTLTVDYIITIS